MEDDSQGEKAASSFFRHRSPTFSKEEIKTLLNIVEKYKTVIFNKSTSASACFAKDSAWVKIAKSFNSQGFTHVRSADSLKTKWENLKKRSRKVSKNLMDVKYSDDDEVNHMVAMMCEAENNTSIIEEPLDSEGDLNISEPEQLKEITSEGHWNDDVEKDSEDSLNGDEDRRLVNRSLNFTPKECNLLLECVRREKNVIMSKVTSATANKVKSKAWSRITNSYNKLSPQKRSTKVLRTKFTNMKKLAKNIGLKDYLRDLGKKHQKLEDTSPSKKIKSEPIFDQYRSNNMADEIDDIDDHESEMEPDTHVDSTIDPLRSVLNSDFSLGSINQLENKEIVKLKTELLNYEMETAKLQRKRIEDLIQADATDREAKAIETSLRLRAARLEAVAAEMKLPVQHPALSYTANEARAQHYIHQYHAS